MKRYVFIILILFLCIKSYAHHISGGEIYYTYLGKSTTDTSKLLYKITLVLYKDTAVNGASTSVASLKGDYNISIYRGDNQQLLFNTVVLSSNYDYMLMKTYSPCLVKKPPVAFSVMTLDTIIEVPNLSEGIYVSHSLCCRVDEIINVKSNEIGATFWVKIPGINENKFAPLNSSAIFNRKDTILICKNFPINLDFSATDSDGDSLFYSFANGYSSITAIATNTLPSSADAPPFTTVDYIAPYTFSQPLGAGVTINPTTGFVSGNAPDSAGVYLIAVWVDEYRNGFKIAQHKKEFQIRVDDCEYTAANLKPTYITCDPKDSLRFSFKNELIIDTATTRYHWDFGELNLTTDTSSKPSPTYTYSDTGVFLMKLTVLNNLGCTSSDSAIVKIFPGYIANFKSVGYCFQNPFIFTNTTYAKYGFTDSVHWDFGESSLTTDTSILAISSYQYLTPGNRMVHLYAHSNKGCIDTVSRLITVLDRPTINLPFRDTLICSIDTLQLKSSSNGVSYLWTPNKWIINNQVSNPFVFPKKSITYILTVTDHSCVSNDSIRVNVLDFITVDAGPNVNICLGDSFKMQTTSSALSYNWTPALTLDDSTKKYPVAFPTKRATTYYVKANLGKCQDKDSITIFTSPHSKITLSPDTSICLGDTVRLFGSNYNGDVFNWSPTTFLSDSNSLSPLIKPTISTTYILTSKYLTGCIKPQKDTIKINVVQPFTVFAGRDTSVVFVQPLQLSALVDDASDKQFVWTRFPIKYPNYLNDTSSQYPIATLPQKVDSIYYIVKAFTKENCVAFDTVRILVYKVPPEIFVPTAFTPNEDGKNDIIKPIPVGIKYLNYFNVYDRWGKLLFTTNEMGRGWDGKVNGVYQNSGAFIFTVQGVDYFGNSIYKKGTFVLIR